MIYNYHGSRFRLHQFKTLKESIMATCKWPPEYYVWRTMKARCLNPNNPKWERYGARGIKVHEPWVNDFQAFYNYVGPRPSDEHSIDRIDNDGHYEPGNVRWATAQEQVDNRECTLKVELSDGRVVTPKEAMEELGLTRGAFYARLYNNIPLSKLVRAQRKIRYPYKGEHLSIYEIAKREKISHRLMYKHIQHDIPVSIAIQEVIDYVRRHYYDEQGNRLETKHYKNRDKSL